MQEESGGAFVVTLRSPAGTTHHAVVVPPGYPERVGWDGVPLSELVRASFEFLLEREPGTSILPRFSLGEIERHFPEYPLEIRRRGPA